LNVAVSFELLVLEQFIFVLGLEVLVVYFFGGILVVRSVDGGPELDRDRVLLPEIRYLHSCLNVVDYLL